MDKTYFFLWIVLFFPILDIILFAIPLYFSLKAKTLIFVISIIIILLIEYLIYAYFTSQKLFALDSLLKVIVNILLLFIFFYKTRHQTFNHY